MDKPPSLVDLKTSISQGKDPFLFHMAGSHGFLEALRLKSILFSKCFFKLRETDLDIDE